MVLTGAYVRSIDTKLRVAIPKPLREQLVKQEKDSVAHVYAAPGTDGSLALYTEDAFARLAEKLSGASPTGQAVRDFSRLFYARAQRVELDAQGRIRIPPELARLIGLPKPDNSAAEAVLVGVRDHIELWESTRWHQYLSERQDQYDRLAEKAFEF